jgi:hypothetical protein
MKGWKPSRGDEKRTDKNLPRSSHEEVSIPVSTHIVAPVSLRLKVRSRSQSRNQPENNGDPVQTVHTIQTATQVP